MSRIQSLFASLGKITKNDAFLVIAFCALVVLAQWTLNRSARLVAECENSALDLLSVQIDRFETLNLKTEGQLIEIKTQLLLLSMGKPPIIEENSQSIAAKKADEAYHVARAAVQKNALELKRACDEIFDIQLENTLFLSLIGAILTFVTFQAGKASAQKVSGKRKPRKPSN